MKTKKQSKTAVFWIAAALLAAGLTFYENNTLCTRSYALPVRNLPQEYEGCRIVQISDLHGKAFGKDHKDLLAAVQAQNPDFIFLTGDLVREGMDSSELTPLFTGLTKLAPTYFVSGNHEWYMLQENRQKLYAAMDESGVIRLSNDFRVCTKNGVKIVVAGVDDPNGPKGQKSPRALVQEIRRQEGEDVCILMLAHRNTQLPTWAHLGVNAVFCGHVHGGIVRLPFLGGVFGTEKDFFPKYDKGVFVMDDTTMLVSSGLGEHNLLPVRILNRPEVSVAVLKGT